MSKIETTITRTICVSKENGFYKCHLCDKRYKLKENYNKHYVSCKFFHSSCLQTHDECEESSENLPTQKELYRFIKEIALKCQRLEDEVEHLKQTMNVRQKKNILDMLNSDPMNANRVPFEQWCSRFQVEPHHLNAVFEGDLMTGIKEVMKPHLQRTCISPHLSLQDLAHTKVDCIPLKAFHTKNALYIYDTDLQWKNAPHNCFDKLVYTLERQFLQAFLVWQRENQEKISLSEKLKDDEIQYMMKICGYKSSGDKIALLKKWVIGVIAEA